MKNGLGNLAASNADQLTAVVRNRLKRIQYGPALIDGFLGQTGLSLEPTALTFRSSEAWCPLSWG
jgi:hypothetical protein